MTGLKVLIVEDESIVALEIESYLNSLDCKVVDVVSDGLEAVTLCKKYNIDLVMMDIFLDGDIDGIEASLKIKEINKDIMIVFLTANNDNYNIQRAVEVDPLVYLSKPFDRKELFAAINIAKNRLFNQQKTSLSDHDRKLLKLDEEFGFDMDNTLLYYHDELVHLTKKETQLLQLFISNKNNLVTNYMIENEIWPDKVANTNTIRTLIKRLREKLKHRFIKNIPARGYVMEV